MMEEVNLSDTPLAFQSEDPFNLNEDDSPDPRIQIELEKLNTSTDLINKLEVDLDEARTMFRQLLSESTHQIDLLTKKLGRCIDQARPYYEARIRAKQYLIQAQKSAVRYEKAVSQHSAAREMVQLAEEGLLNRGCVFDSTWQEMLNHATTKVNDAEMERTESTLEHQEKFNIYQESENRVQYLQRELKRAIAKSSLNARRSLMQLSNIVRMQDLQLLPYFELKAAVNRRLDEQKKHIKELERAVSGAKLNYSEALANLETISDEIHHSRQSKTNRIKWTGAESPGLPVGTCNSQSPPILSSSKAVLKINKRSLSLEGIQAIAANRNRNASLSNPLNGSVIDKFKEESTSSNADDGESGSDFSGWQFVTSHNVVPSFGSNLLMVEDKDSIISDSESLASMEMLTEEAISNLMLDDEISAPLGSPLVDENIAPPSSVSLKNKKFQESSKPLSQEPSQCIGSSKNSSSSSGGTWEVVSEPQESSSTCEVLEYGSLGITVPKVNDAKEIGDKLSPLSNKEGSTSPSRPKTLSVSPSYCRPSDNECLSSDSSEQSESDSDPAYALLCDTPLCDSKSVNI